LSFQHKNQSYEFSAQKGGTLIFAEVLEGVLKEGSCPVIGVLSGINQNY